MKTFICQGKVDPQVIEMMYKMFPQGHAHGQSAERDARHKVAASHPNEEVKVRALISILITLYTYRKRTQLYPQIADRLAALAETPGFIKTIRTIILRFILARETEKITRKLQDEIIPEMLKLSPKLSKKINRRCFFPSFNSTEVAVTDVQFDCQLLLRHAFGLAQVLDTFAGGVRIKVHKPALRPQCNAVASCAIRSERKDTVGGSDSACRDSVCTR